MAKNGSPQRENHLSPDTLVIKPILSTVGFHGRKKKSAKEWLTPVD
jgi:hypothetical protein